MSSNQLHPRPLLMPMSISMSVSRGVLILAALAALLSEARPAAGRTAAEAIAAGDEAYAAARLEDARAAYVEATKAAPKSVPALCRASRACSELGETQKGDTQRMTWAEAVQYARDAVRVAPDSAAPHVWLAVALGRQAQREGAKTRLALAKEIKAEAERAISLDPGIGRAWHVIAAWNAGIAGLSSMQRMAANTVLGGVPKGASRENAEAAFQKAIELEPRYVNHRVAYGRLLKDMKRNADARKQLEQALALPPTSSALDARYQSEARELLEKLPR
jgi:tetratricopeptide (TPR) repeat protein